MTDSEQSVVNFLSASPETLYGRKEILRKAVRRQVYEAEPHWADAALASLEAQEIIEKNKDGLYRMKQPGGDKSHAR